MINIEQYRKWRPLRVAEDSEVAALADGKPLKDLEAGGKDRQRAQTANKIAGAASDRAL